MFDLGRRRPPSGMPVDSWLANMFSRPSGETVHDDDDEFDTDTSADFTEIDPTGTTTWTIDGHTLSCVFDGQAANDLAGYVKSLTPTVSPVTLQSAMSAIVDYNDVTFVGICFADGAAATSNVLALCLVTDPWRIFMRSGTFTNAATAPVSIPVDVSLWSRCYVRLIWLAADSYKLQVSRNGADGSWTDLGLPAEAVTLTPSRVGFVVSTWESTGTIEGVASWDYLRVDESDLSA